MWRRRLRRLQPALAFVFGVLALAYSLHQLKPTTMAGLVIWGHFAVMAAIVSWGLLLDLLNRLRRTPDNYIRTGWFIPTEPAVWEDCLRQWRAFMLEGGSGIDEGRVRLISQKLYASLGRTPPSRVVIADSPRGMPRVAPPSCIVSSGPPPPPSFGQLLDRELAEGMQPFHILTMTSVLRLEVVRSWSSIMSAWPDRRSFPTRLELAPVVDYLQRTSQPLAETMKFYRELVSCGVWLAHFHDDTLYVCRRPAAMRMDAQGRLHKLGGAAVVWQDGLCQYFVQGVQMAERHVLHPSDIAAADILSERNLERRRVLLELLGLERFFAQLDPLPLDSDRDAAGMARQLLRVELPREEPMVYVRVHCPSTSHTHLLRVPPTMTTCAEAVAWTFDLPVANYHPLVEA